MDFFVFSLYFEKQLHNTYSYVLAYIKSILPEVISFHLSYSLPLCIENSQRYMSYFTYTGTVYIPSKRNSVASCLMTKHKLIQFQVQNTLVLGTDYFK